jgi:hypothetical protein
LSASPRKKAENIKGKIMAKKKISELNQTHGKVDGVKPTTLDQIWGDTGLSKYKTLDENEYSRQLSELSKTDLQAHAASLGIIPIDNRETLTSRLIKEFRRHVSAYTVPNQQIKSTKLSLKALNILKEGK